MAITLLQAVQRINRHIAQDPTITSFSDDDDSNLIVDYINDAMRKLYREVPNLAPLDARSTISTVANTRLYSVAVDANVLEIYEWSVENQGDEYSDLKTVTLEDIQERFDDYATREGQPEYTYIEGQQLGFYPIPDDVYTIGYVYKSLPSRLSGTSDVFPFKDDIVEWFILNAVAEYKIKRSFADAAVAKNKADELYASIYGEYDAKRPTYFRV